MNDPVIDKEAARTALEDVSQMQQRSTQGIIAFYAAPHFVIWGVVWTIAFLVADFSQSAAKIAWPVSALLGNAAMWLLIVHQAKRRPVLAKKGRAGPLFWTWVLVALGIFLSLSPSDGPRLLSYLCMIFIGMPCLMAGIWGRSAYVGLVGTGVTTISLIGIFFAERSYYNRWMMLAGILLLVSGSIGKRRWKVSHV